MSTDYDSLFQRLREVPHGREQIAVFEELLRLADSNKDIPTAYEARRDYVRLCCEEGFPEKGIVAFSWCLAQFDKDPELDDEHSLIWQYKVILELIPVFHSVSRDQIIRLQEDMAKRLAHLGVSERTAHYYRCWNLMRMGDYDDALRYQEQYMAMARDSMSDCKACEADRQVELLVRMHKDEEALKLAKPIMSGQMRCGEVPEFTNGHLVKSLVRTGKETDAVELAKSGFKLVQNERKYIGTLGDLLLIPVRARDFQTGLRQITKYLPWVADCAAGELKFRFLNATALFFEAFAAQSPGKQVKVRIPENMGFSQDGDLYDAAMLAERFFEQTKALAGLFNQRNGNDRYNQLMADNRAIAGLG